MNSSTTPSLVAQRVSAYSFPALQGSARGLGISTEFAAPAKIKDLRLTPTPETAFRIVLQTRSERYSLQQTAQVVTGQIAQSLNQPGQRPVISDRVTYCGSSCEGHAVIKKYGSDNERQGRALFSGLHVCGNQWLCPVCSQLVSEYRADEMRQALDWAKSKGYHCELHTLTLRHGVNDTLESLVSGMAEAWRWLTSHKAFKALKSLHGYVGYMRSMEVTHGQHGWHPHYHLILISERPFAPDRLRLSSLWCNAVARQGLPEPDLFHGYDIRDGSEAGTYLNKFADDTKLDSSSPERVLTRKGDAVTWDAADEMTKYHSKKGRSGSLTPFDFLRVLRMSWITGQTDDVPRFKGLWQEYALAMRGRSRVQWSRGLRALVGLDQIDDQEALERLEERAREVVGVIPEELWPVVLTRGSHDNRSAVLETAEQCGVVGVAHFLWSYMDMLGAAPSDWATFLKRMLAEVQDYQENTDAATSKHWQAVMPVNPDRVVESGQLREEMLKPIT